MFWTITAYKELSILLGLGFCFLLMNNHVTQFSHSRVMKRKCLHGGSLKYATTRIGTVYRNNSCINEQVSNLKPFGPENVIRGLLALIYLISFEKRKNSWRIFDPISICFNKPFVCLIWTTLEQHTNLSRQNLFHVKQILTFKHAHIYLYIISKFLLIL